MPFQISPPPGWVILRHDRHYYPAAIITKEPHGYALAWRSTSQSPQRFIDHMAACDYAAQIKNKKPTKVELRVIEDMTGFELISENPADEPSR